MPIEYTDEEIHNLGIAVMRLAKDYGIKVKDAIHSVAEGNHDLASAIGRHLAVLANEVRRKKKEQREKDRLERERLIQEEVFQTLALLQEQKRLCDAEDHQNELLAGFIVAGHEDDI